MTKTVWLVSMVAAALNMIVQSSAAAADAAETGTCESLRTQDFSMVLDAPTQVISAHRVAATAQIPAHCRVNGYAAPNVGFGIMLPEVWNGKFMQIGCGGYCGMALEGDNANVCNDTVGRGYACLASDMGHKGMAIDGLWAYQDLQAQASWAVSATHVATLAGKAIAQKYYAQALRKSYFMGCSTGGRQALQAAQRFPWDFDGIVAGAPGADIGGLLLSYVWAYQAMHDESGHSRLNVNDMKRVTAAALKRCDRDDGVNDGIIGNPLQCPFDVGDLACTDIGTESCLTPEQINAVRKIYAGPTTPDGVKLVSGGPLPGSEGDSWESYLAGPLVQLYTDAFRYLFFSPAPGPTWALNDFDFTRDYKRMGVMQAFIESAYPDLRRFKAAGGKLLIYQGTNDAGLVRPAIDYHDTVERTMGGRRNTQEFFRMFLLPGVGHCSGGPGADAADFLSYLEAWAERGQAPERIVSGHVKEPDPMSYPYQLFPRDPAQLSFTRPIYPYPAWAQYTGKGDPNDANNFRPVRPD